MIYTNKNTQSIDLNSLGLMWGYLGEINCVSEKELSTNNRSLKFSHESEHGYGVHENSDRWRRVE